MCMRFPFLQVFVRSCSMLHYLHLHHSNSWSPIFECVVRRKSIQVMAGNSPGLFVRCLRQD